SKAPEIDGDARACIRNLRVDATVRSFRFICLVIHEAYNWDRSPVPVAQKLTYGATLKLKALPRDLYPCCGAQHPWRFVSRCCSVWSGDARHEPQLSSRPRTSRRRTIKKKSRVIPLPTLHLI
ncbi:hypothetical protein EV363DRAFT_1163408, partial [Boletus edulis]